jgi:hypothetical protein
MQDTHDDNEIDMLLHDKCPSWASLGCAIALHLLQCHLYAPSLGVVGVA